jgi:RNA polymerase sigma factor (sigma-70 family)
MPGMAVVRPAQTGNETGCETIEQLFNRLESPLLSYALRLCGRVETAEDIVQEAFVKLHAKFEEIHEPKRWLYRTVHNLALNHRRQAGRIVSLTPAEPGSTDSPEVEPADPELLPDEQIARLEGIGLVRLSVKALDARGRELIRLKFEENLSYKEISARMGLTVGNVGYLLHHALKEIGDELARNGVVP